MKSFVESMSLISFDRCHEVEKLANREIPVGSVKSQEGVLTSLVLGSVRSFSVLVVLFLGNDPDELLRINEPLMNWFHSRRPFLDQLYGVVKPFRDVTLEDVLSQQYTRRCL